jgi:glycopeptide antibiotics resistance protein
LYIPERFQIVNHLFLEPPWSEIHTDDYYLKDGLINIAGFIPLGFVLIAYFSLAKAVRRPLLSAVIVGCSISLSIEIIQAYLPTRFSGVTDIVTNTLGTAIGGGLFFLMMRGWRHQRLHTGS